MSPYEQQVTPKLPSTSEENQQRSSKIMSGNDQVDSTTTPTGILATCWLPWTLTNQFMTSAVR